MNRSLLESAYHDLVTYRDQMTAVIDTMGAFLKLQPASLAVQAPPAAAAVPTPAPEPAAAPVRTEGPTTTAQKQKLAKAATSTSGTASTAAVEQRILGALTVTSPQRPGDLVETLGLGAHVFKLVSTTLEERGLVTVSGKPVNRRIAITEQGRRAFHSAAGSAPSRPQSEADVVAARDKAVRDHLKINGPSKFDQILLLFPGTFPSEDAKRAALKASLRRLILRSEVIDAGEVFKLRVAA